ncbi:MAG: response regulator [Planctomycetota bacterium]
MTPSKTVLTIDDDRTITGLIQARCEAMGLRSIVAHSIVHAARYLDSQLPDLITFDVHMPPGNGLQLIKALAEDPAASRIPVIVLTEQLSPQAVGACRRLCAYYMIKSEGFWTRLEPVIHELVEIDGGTRRRASRGSRESHKLD